MHLDARKSCLCSRYEILEIQLFLGLRSRFALSEVRQAQVLAHTRAISVTHLAGSELNFSKKRWLGRSLVAVALLLFLLVREVDVKFGDVLKLEQR